METKIQLVHEPIAERMSPPSGIGAHGAWLEFRGVVRGQEDGQDISALEYEAYSPMAENEIRRILDSLAARHPCLAARVIHRVGVIPVGEAAIYVGLAAPHRAEAIALLAEFMDRLKQDVPIWKLRGVPVWSSACRRPEPAKAGTPNKGAVRSLDDALAEIQSHCRPLPALRVPLAEAFGRVLRETVSAPSDLPDHDRSTRDGYAILESDASEVYQVVDTLHAADWKPRQFKSGQAVRVATGAALPGDNLRVVMQEHVERNGDQIRLTRRDDALNVRRRGEDVKAGQPLVQAGVRLDAGKLAVLASAGCARPLVSPQLRVAHFTTGDELVPPDETPKQGQIRDSNSYLIRGLVQKFPCQLHQAHLPEDLEMAKQTIKASNFQPPTFNPVLISGGASVGDKDFTRPLLEWLGFEIVFSQVNIRPGRPLIFGVNGNRVAFGLPGNPLSHFVCFHLFVAAALANLTGGESRRFSRGTLAAKLDEAPNPRETLWPAQRKPAGLRPLTWASSGDVVCLAETDTLIRLPANCSPMEAGAEIEFLPLE